MINIRKANLNDLEPLSELFNGYRVFYKKESNLIAAESFIKERLKKEDAEIFVSFDKHHNMTGFTQLYPLFSSTRMKRLWLLNDLFVHPDFRGQGFSIALIERAKQLCRESKSCGMMLETGIDNKIGNQLYPRTGFELNQGANFYSWDI